MLGLSLPYCLASPLLGYITDKYPVSMKAANIIKCGGFCHNCKFVILNLCVCWCLPDNQDLVHGDRKYHHSSWLLSAWSRPFPSHPEVSMWYRRKETKTRYLQRTVIVIIIVTANTCLILPKFNSDCKT